ncbi:hypothetical protein A3D23_07020 [candidate division WOR-1 bacterium RIFCSPHIGHO2_02_FULL_53_26]|nr:MAG: hypothetical protein A3D23_07020 [candidate division WOR-1 bacterium RIFCSPHIGHO2_02_FULL_53_26]
MTMTARLERHVPTFVRAAHGIKRIALDGNPLAVGRHLYHSVRKYIDLRSKYIYIDSERISGEYGSFVDTALQKGKAEALQKGKAETEGYNTALSMSGKPIENGTLFKPLRLFLCERFPFDPSFATKTDNPAAMRRDSEFYGQVKGQNVSRYNISDRLFQPIGILARLRAWLDRFLSRNWYFRG